MECLLRCELKIDYSCKTGNCQSCLLKSIAGDVDKKAQKGLKPTAIEQGFFLACQQQAEAIQKAESIDNELIFSHARLVNKQLFSNDICQLIIEPVSPLYYHAGQFINLKNSQGIVRSYSIANIPSEQQLIELHIHKKTNGAMSHWLFNEFNVGDNIDFQGPIGECFYTSENKNKPMILIGTGTGAAPLIGIVRDALKSGHQGLILFYHGARNIEGLYLHDMLSNLDKSHSNFNYLPSISHNDDLLSNLGSNDSAIKIVVGRCNEIAIKKLQPTPQTILYLCGNPEMVNTTRKKAFLAGIASKNIYIDPFEYKDLRKSER
ncbi:MAG: FAD-binding oxidoreductase [Colwellia sp.]|nr:FAD-binding oxidoreductase [Colwellia sp.]